LLNRSDSNITLTSEPVNNWQLGLLTATSVEKTKELQEAVLKQTLPQSLFVKTENSPGIIKSLERSRFKKNPGSSQVRPAGREASVAQVTVDAEELVDVAGVVVVEVTSVEVTSAGRTKDRAARSRGFLNAIFIILY
jgi:hypothetical protein